MNCPKCNKEIGIMKALINGVEHCVECAMPPKESVKSETKDFDFSIFTKEQQVILKKFDEEILTETAELTNFNEVIELSIELAIENVNNDLEDYINDYNDDNGTRIEIDFTDGYKLDIENKTVSIKLTASKRKVLNEIEYEVDVEFNNLTGFNLTFI